ncbi:6-phosphofructokinase, alpha subunit [Salvia divinorum]|uniref:6-phosphofructokinase, alpha subunit n=1 Tax=Salvia divinorum TaxID=28513 RepID=A0ABD1HTP0_SALDI
MSAKSATLQFCRGKCIFGALLGSRSFGFNFVVEEVVRAIIAEHVEATSFENDIDLMKLMGRYSGFIATYATLASLDVDCYLIPESSFILEHRHMDIVIVEGGGLMRWS